jgi:hypothetical protein
VPCPHQKGNWDELVKKFLVMFFPISKVQDLRRQVLTFKQEEDEGIDEAWDRFNELHERGPNLGFFGDLMLHTFYFSLTPNSSHFESLCGGGDIMDKIIREAAQILQRISNGQKMQRDWQRRCREEQIDKSKPEVLAEISEKDEPEVKEDEPTIQEIEDPLPKVREVISNAKNVKTNMNVGRSLWNARPLGEFNQSSWIQVDFAQLINYRRKEERRHVAKLVEDIFDQEMSGESIQKIFEEEREEGDEGWIVQLDNSRIYDEEREEYNRDEPSDSKDKWGKIGLNLEDEWEGVDIEQILQEDPSPQGDSLCDIEAYTLANQDMEALNDEEKSESTMSDLDDMCYTGEKESNIQDFEDEDWDDNEDFKEEMNANIIDGLHIPHDEVEGVQKGNKETPSLVEIDSPSTPLNEPNITLVEKALWPRYTLKSQNIIGIYVDKFKYSCSTNSMIDNLNSMPCSNNDHVGRLDFLENEKEETFMFDPINLTPKEPLPNDNLSAMHETYASFIYTLTCCYNSHMVLIMDAYVYNKFCKSRSCFAHG